jgi:CxxC motif-containing protein (DUF1111 family)
MTSTMNPHVWWGVCFAVALGATACGGGSEDGSGTRNSPVVSMAKSIGTPTRATPGQPGQMLKPVAATSSAVENPGMSAAAAYDGNPNSRWSSAFVDDAWIQFEFGSSTDIGSMKLVWENSYGKEYTLQASDDGQSWTQLRHVTDGKGGTEEFLSLGVKARYIRLQGVARNSQYGYSLYEVEFRTPGSDNTQAPQATSPMPFPPDGQALAPLPAVREPLEQVQFTLADGTLVTRFGARALGRHGRERGEEWNEIGYGPNDTVDAVGQPVDRGPGAHLTFVTQYFKNRTWGMEIIDNSRVAGVTRPTLVVNRYTTVDFLPGDTAFFRAFDRVGVTGFGWMSPGELVDRSVRVCAPTPYPANGRLGSADGINGACTLRVKDYPGHGGLGSDGLPNGTYVPSRPLVAGDVIEVSPAMFTTREALDAKGDSGGNRYYSAEWLYVVGSGLTPWYGVQPRLNSVPLPAATLSGGLGSVSYNYSDNGSSMFQQPFNHIGMQNMQRFVEGRRLVHTDFTTGAHSEPGNEPYAAAARMQGAHFNQSMCAACHVNNGRSPAPSRLNQRLDTMSLHAASHTAAGQQQPHPRYGNVVQMNATAAAGHAQDWGNSVRVAQFDTREVRLADGTVVELRKPVLAFDGVAPAAHSLRAAPPMIGMGLLEAVPEADILSLARSAPDADGVKGQPNYVYDPESGVVRLGRFGWKAAKATLRQQTATALLQDMAVTSPVYPSRSCHYGPAACSTGPRVAGITESDLTSLSHYLALVAVPAQRSLPSGFPKGVAPLDEHRVDAPQVALGARLFDGMRCTACHAAQLQTGSGHLFAELRNQTIRPYTDLLLHDMGPGLADNFAEGQARGALWRTAPLWGIGYTEKVMGRGRAADVGYLHDGRARTLTEAILWHGGEADAARQRFSALPRTDREALLAFLRSL